jgi:hypothetical protein
MNASCGITIVLILKLIRNSIATYESSLVHNSHITDLNIRLNILRNMFEGVRNNQIDIYLTMKRLFLSLVTEIILKTI